MRPSVECPPMARAICVLGMHRSGTSLVARLLDGLGVYFGDDRDFLPPNRANTQGYWEIRAVAELQDAILEELSLSWATAHPLPEGWERRPGIEPHRARLAELVQATFSGHELFGWKDPRTCLLLPLWEPILARTRAEVHYVVVVRNPLDVAMSLVKRDDLDLDAALGTWLHYNLRILTDTKDEARTLVSYETLLDRQGDEVERLSQALCLRKAESNDLDSGIIDPNLCHFRTTAGELRERAPELVLALYDLLEQAARDEISPVALDALAGEMLGELKRYSTLLGHDRYGAGRSGEIDDGGPLDGDSGERLRSKIEYLRRRLASETENRRSLQARLDVAIETLRSHASALDEIHQSRLWQLADRYWQLRRWLGLAR